MSFRTSMTGMGVANKQAVHSWAGSSSISSCPNRDAAPAETVQNGVVVEPEAFPNRGTREPLLVEFGCRRELCFGHAA